MAESTPKRKGPPPGRGPHGMMPGEKARDFKGKIERASCRERVLAGV